MEVLLSTTRTHPHTVEMDEMERFGALVRDRRMQLRMKAEDVASAIGRPMSFLSRIENGKNSNPPDPQVFHDLAKALNLHRADMLVALGYLESDIDQEQFESPAERDLLRTIRAMDWTPAKIAAAVTMLDALDQMARELQGTSVAPGMDGVLVRVEDAELEGEG